MNRPRLLVVALAVGIIAGGILHLLGPPRARHGGARCWPDLFSQDGRWLVVEENDRKGDRRRWLVVDALEGEPRLEFPGRRVLAWAFSPDGRLLARAADYTDARNGIDVWDLETGREVVGRSWRVLPPNLNSNLPGARLAFTDDGRLLAYACNLGIYDVAARKRLGDLKPVHPAGPMPDRHLYSALLGYHQERTWVRLWSVTNGRVVSDFPLPAALRNYAWSPGGRFLAADFYDRAGVVVIDGHTGTSFATAEGDSSVVVSVSDDGPVLAVATEVDATGWLRRWLPAWLAPPGGPRPVIRLIDVPSGHVTDELPGSHALLTADARTLAVQTPDGALELWDLPRPRRWYRSVGGGLAAAGLVVLGAAAWARNRRGRHVTPAASAPASP